MGFSFRNDKESNDVIFSPATGNWGDGLINYGSRQFFDFYKINYKEIHKKETTDALNKNEFNNKVVVIGGGGAWCKNFSSTKSITKKIATVARKVIVLPTTYELLGLESENVIYFSRDKFGSKENIKESFFCHDMAFFTKLNIEPPQERVWRIAAMRNDREGLGYADRFELNLDFSMLGDGDYKSVYPLFNILSNFKVISTDRLHLGIVGAMLGMQVNLVPGNYFKVKDIWKSTLCDNYSNVKIKSIEEVLSWYGK